MTDELPSVLQHAVNLLGLPSANVTIKEINSAFKRKATRTPFLDENFKVYEVPSLKEVVELTEAKKLISHFVRTGSFTFRCANCFYKTRWDISLYVEVEDTLLCHKCQAGVLKIVKNVT